MKKVYYFLMLALIYSYLIQFSIIVHASENSLQPTTLVAIGSIFEKNIPYKALFSYSIDGGKSWGIGNSISFPSDINSVHNVSCSGDAPSAFCAAIIASIQGGNVVQSNIAISNDGGQDWEIKANTLRNKSNLTGISCTGRTYPICVATGYYIFHGNRQPYLLLSKDAGNTWEEKSGNFGGTGDGLGYVSCSGEGDLAICITHSDRLLSPTYEPNFIVSIDGGKTWQYKNFLNLSEEKISIQDTNCYGDETNNICIANGQMTSQEGAMEGPPLLAVSKNKGETWKTMAINKVPEKGYFVNSVCTKNNVSSTCLAIGTARKNTLIYGYPIIAVSNDDGNTWELKRPVGSTVDGALTSVSCAEGNSKTICAAVGSQILNGRNIPLLISSIDGGKTWMTRSNDKMLTTGSLEKVKCFIENKNITCVAIGAKYSSEGAHPFVVISTDDSNNWEEKPIINLPSETLGGLQGMDITL